MEFVQHDDGSRTQIPDEIISASEDANIEVAHPDPKRAKAGHTILQHKRVGVEAYVKATPAQREQLHAAAKAKLAPKEETPAPAPAAAAADDDE
jgi:hypothetical protein